MKVLCTMPGKFGDVLWSLPTVRAIAEAAGEPVDLCLSRNYGTDPFCDLLKGQSYLRGVFAEPTWIVRDTAPMTPQRPSFEDVATPMHNINGYNKVLHLGYERWPQNLLPVEIYLQATGQWGSNLPKLELDTPWIEVESFSEQSRLNVQDMKAEGFRYIGVGFTDEWIELKAGLLFALRQAFPGTDGYVFIPQIAHGSRWEEWGVELERMGIILCSHDWVTTARWMADDDLFLGCLSAQWVLANALGIPTVIMEPSEPRHSPIFFYNHPRNTLVLGNDGKPTFDARAVVDAVRSKLHG